MKDQRVFGLIFKNNSGVNFRDQLNGILAFSLIPSNFITIIIKHYA